MDFEQKKLPKSAVEKMRGCLIGTVKPFALMLAPVYVYMKLNEKFVAVKAPLDFFNEEELERLKPFGEFFLPDEVEETLKFREVARKVKALLLLQPRGAKTGEKREATPYPEEPLPPAPYELSDAVLRMLAPLWRLEGKAETVPALSVAAFANEICELLPGDLMKQARDTSVANFERAIFISSWSVFLALHLGHCEVDYLNRLRSSVFGEIASGGESSLEQAESVELTRLAMASLRDPDVRELSVGFFSDRSERVSQKLSTRFRKIRTLIPAPEIEAGGAPGV